MTHGSLTLTSAIVLYLLGTFCIHAFQSILTDSSGAKSYIAAVIHDVGSYTLNVTVYEQTSYSSSPICSDCVIFNDSLQLQTAELSMGSPMISEETLAIRIQYDDKALNTKEIYLFIGCPILQAIRVRLPSRRVEYLSFDGHGGAGQTEDSNTRCVLQQQQDTNDAATIRYMVYQHQHLFLYEYDPTTNMQQLTETIDMRTAASLRISADFSNAYFVFCRQMIYTIVLPSNGDSCTVCTASLSIARYDTLLRTWTVYDDILGAEFSGVRDSTVVYAGIHRTENAQLSILHIVLASLVDTDIYSVHRYAPSVDDTSSIVVNDFNFNIALPSSFDLAKDRQVIYYRDVNEFLRTLPYNVEYAQWSSSHLRRRRLQTKIDPECRDASDSCSLIPVGDCQEEGIKNLCRATCRQCEETTFNCSDFVPSMDTVDVCQFPKESPSFCSDPDGWFMFFCPITCKHSNCTQQWMTYSPTPQPTTIATTTYHHDTTLNTTTTHIQALQTEADNNDMSPILILLAMLLLCLFFASILLWICVNIVKLQRMKNHQAYHAMTAMMHYALKVAPSEDTHDHNRISPREPSPFQRG